MENYDAFLVGDGSAKLLDSYIEVDSCSRQITNPFNAADEDESFIEIKSDIESLVDDTLSVKLEGREEINFAFYSYKKEAYNLFGYVELKSSQMAGIPIKIEDLVMDDADKYLIDYLSSFVDDLYTWKQLAKLHACSNMGISHVRFVPDHDCPLCKALSGSIVLVDEMIKLLCRGGHFSHPYCPCDLAPVVYRESYSGSLVGQLDKDLITLGDRDFLHVPKELLVSTELEDIAAKLLCPEVDFVNMPQWCRDNKIESSGLVAYLEDETLYVHNSYIGNATPLDYLNSFIDSESLPSKLMDRNKADAYWMDGREVLKYKGSYYDHKTLERLK
jgi:hypothetical protein